MMASPNDRLARNPAQIFYFRFNAPGSAANPIFVKYLWIFFRLTISKTLF